MPPSVQSAEATELFVGPVDAPLQLVRVNFTGAPPATNVQVTGDGLRAEPAEISAGDGTVDIAVEVTDPHPGRRRTARAAIGDTGIDFDFDFDFDFVDAEPGWTMFMVSHFHYDPVWWNTQAAYTSQWTEDPPGRARQTNGFALVQAHLEMARRDPDYKFVLAEVDYLKPFWDTHPEDRADLRRFIADGRVEIMGGTYNEPNTNLTSPETAIRNFVHGMGFQHHVLGARPATAWQLDVFGHDPQFPGMAADAGLTSSSWARGPHHQWGPMSDDGDPERMQFASEFEWIAPSGTGLLTHYMPAHYSAGWWMDSAASLPEAEAATYELFAGLKKVSATRNVLLPVGTDYTPPNKWVTDIHRDWNQRYTWPRFVCALPAEFFAAVRTELAGRDIAAAPQTRDMNPIYTGKDVSFIDTKQANRAAEHAVLDAERFAVFARLLAGAHYPEPALAKAWVQLAYGAHHDAITGSESDQVYLDLLTSWRDAWELGRITRDNALRVLTDTLGGPVTVWNPLSHSRTDIATVYLEHGAPGGGLVDDTGTDVPVVIGDDGHTVTFLARDVPSLGWRCYRWVPGDPAPGWQPKDGSTIATAGYRVEVDPQRGGAVSSLLRHGRQLLAAGRVGNELAVYDEYPAHPKAGEGPWHLLPRGPVTLSSAAPAQVQAYRSALGSRLVVRGEIPGILAYTQTLTLYDGVERLDCRTVIDGFTGADQLLRLRWPANVPGAMPVSEVGDAVIGRGFGLLHQPGTEQSIDTAVHPWTLENPAYGWFGVSAPASVDTADGYRRAFAVAEVVTPTETVSAPLARALLVALVRAGVTATCSGADKPRYGHLDVDSNLPDIRIAIGSPQQNSFTGAVLTAAGPAYTAEFQRQLDSTGTVRLFIPADAPLAQSWRPDADLRGERALPVLVIAGRDEQALSAELAAVADDLCGARIPVHQQVPGEQTPFEDRTVALLNRGVPSFAVDPDGTLHTSLMRSCTGWPSGVWTTHEARRTPDGTNFQLQHWTHTFDYAVVAEDGDWRDAGISAHSAQFSRPLVAVTGPGDGAAGAGSLLQIDAHGVTLDALKLHGNPTAEGSAHPVEADTVVLRLVEQHGRTCAVRVHSDVMDIQTTAKADLRERNPRPTDRIDLHGYEIATVLARVEAPAERGDIRLGPDAETAQPVYARYWLHNRGPAPLGGLPVAPHLHQIDDNRMELSIASDCTDTALAGSVDIIAPPGWSVHPATLPFDLSPGAHLSAELTVTVPPHAEPGSYPLRAQLGLTNTDAPQAWRQRVEDVQLWTVGTSAAQVLRLVEGPNAIRVRAGSAARLTMTVGTDALADLAVEAHLISPWGTWEWMGPAAIGAELPAQGNLQLNFDITPPYGLTPGRWWALVRVAAAGHLLYTPAVEVIVE